MSLENKKLTNLGQMLKFYFEPCNNRKYPTYGLETLLPRDKKEGLGVFFKKKKQNEIHDQVNSAFRAC